MAERTTSGGQTRTTSSGATRTTSQLASASSAPVIWAVTWRQPIWKVTKPMKATTLYKLPGEQFTFGFDFTDHSVLVSGDTLTGTPTVQSTLVSGSGTLVIGTPAISGKRVLFTIQGGTVDAEWKIVCTVQTAAGATLQAKGTLKIEEV